MSAEGPKSHWFLKTVLSFFAFCIVSYVIDLSIARWADRILLARNADFELQLQNANLDFDGPRTQGCNQRYIFKVYLYQTCFVRTSIAYNGFDERFFTYTFQRPQPWIIGRGDGTAYYFQATSMGQSLMIVHPDFSVEKKTTGKTF